MQLPRTWLKHAFKVWLRSTINVSLLDDVTWIEVQETEA